jgi:hypothetical protein
VVAPTVLALALVAALVEAKPPMTTPRTLAPAAPGPACGDFDRLADDPDMINRQRSPECDHVPSLVLYQEANRLRYGYGGVPRDWARAAELYRQSAELTGRATHPQLGFFRWRDAMQSRALLLRQGGHGLARDVPEARRIGGLLDWHPGVLAELDEAIRAEAVAASPAPTVAMQPGRWSIRQRTTLDGRLDDDETELQCLDAGDLKEIAHAAPEDQACAWTSLSRSATALRAAWTCDHDLDEDPSRPFDERIERHAISIDFAPERVGGRKTSEHWAPHASEPTRREEVELDGQRVGDC